MRTCKRTASLHSGSSAARTAHSAAVRRTGSISYNNRSARYGNCVIRVQRTSVLVVRTARDYDAARNFNSAVRVDTVSVSVSAYRNVENSSGDVYLANLFLLTFCQVTVCCVDAVVERRDCCLATDNFNCFRLDAV